MNPATSLLLDFLRVFAALGVVLVHSGTTQFAPAWSIDPGMGHHCVVIFFVLSGYVIAHASFSRPQTASDYAVARLARLYSVLLPALLVTAALLLVGRAVNPGVYASFDRGNESVRFALSLGFLNEIWQFSAAPPTNIPLWSLSYEFWYYALFGVFFFARSRLFAIMLAAGIATLVGPKIFLLLPVWLLGLAAYRLAGHSRVNRKVAFPGLVTASILLALWWRTGGAFPGRIGYPPFFFSNAYVSDFVLGVFVAGLIFFFHQVSATWQVPRWIGLPIRGGANMTFSLYLLHYPLFVFLGATLPYNHGSRAQSGLLLLGVIGVAAILSRFTEARRKPLATWLRRQSDFLAGVFKKRHALP